MFHVFTSIVANYIPKARLLATTLKKHHPDAKFHLVLSDRVPNKLEINGKPFDSLLTPKDLPIPARESWLFKHTIVEMCTGVKGWAFLEIIKRHQAEKVIFLDPDIAVFSRMDGILEQLDDTSIALTPHLTEPEESLEGILDNEISSMKHGIYNLGFLGIRSSEESLRFLNWWTHRLENFCYDDLPGGLFTDQRWIDLAPAFFKDVGIIRDPIYNLSTWNLSSRKVSDSPKKEILVNGRPLCFMHFSGFDSGAHNLMLNKYGGDNATLSRLSRWYLNECKKFGQEHVGETHCIYNYYDNGEIIPKEHRVLYRTRVDLQQAFQNPFYTGDVNKSYYHWFHINGYKEIHGGGSPEPRPVSKAGDPSTETQSPRTYRELSKQYGLGESPYVICLQVYSGEEALLQETLAQIFRHSYKITKVLIVAVGAKPKAIKAVSDKFPDFEANLEILHVKGPRKSPMHHVLSVLPTRFNDCDILLVRAGCQLSQGWNDRLMWAAYMDPQTATLSPMCGASSLFSIIDKQVFKEWEDVDTLTLNRLACTYGQRKNVEVPAYLPACVYMRREALNRIGSQLNDLMQCNPKDFDCSLATAFAWSGWHNMLCDHVYVKADKSHHKLLYQAIESQKLVQSTQNNHPLAPLRYVITDALRHGGQGLDIDGLNETPVQLHILHSWGGGLEKWVSEFCQSDFSRTNFILKSIGNWGEFGQRLELYDGRTWEKPIKFWEFKTPIQATTVSHFEYQSVLNEIINEFCVDVIYVSSLIGHSLDALNTGIKTVMVCHDYYPFCQALSIYYDEVCTHCDEKRLSECNKHNPHNKFFNNISPQEWMAIRRRFFKLVLDNSIPLIVPSDSVRRNMQALIEPFDSADFQVVPHGTRPFLNTGDVMQPGTNGKFRIMILGSVDTHKGGDLLKEIQDALTPDCEFHLVGCGEKGEEFKGQPGVHVLPSFNNDDLPEIVRDVSPDIGLLTSLVPETFSYTLSEMFYFGIPSVAPDRGSFSDRIQDGQNGFLCESTAEAFIDKIEELKAQPKLLNEVRTRLKSSKNRSLVEMIEDYHRLSPVPPFNPYRYFSAPRSQARGDQAGSSAPALFRPDPNFKQFLDDTYNFLMTKLSHTPRLRPWERRMCSFFLKKGHQLLSFFYRNRKPGKP